MGVSNQIQRDYVLMKKGDTVTVRIDDYLFANGWFGGQFLAWKDPYYVDGKPELVVGRCNGIQMGPMAMWGSNELEDSHTGFTDQFRTHKYVQCTYGNQIFMTRHFETQSYFARTGLATLTDFYGSVEPVLNASAFAMDYKVGNPLYVSDRGFLTTEQVTSKSVFIGFIWQKPTPETALFLGVGVTL
jgi:hypothetical protein